MNWAGFPPKGWIRAKIAQLQMQIANTLCRLPAQEGIGTKKARLQLEIANTVHSLQAFLPREGVEPRSSGCNCRLQIHSAGISP